MLRAATINPYIGLMYGEFSKWTFAENAPQKRGVWRAEAFQRESDQPLDLEIGTGNGYHFAHHAHNHPGRSLIGLELKYKPLVQTIRRCLRQDSTNARMVRFDASQVSQLFAPGEVDNVFIHHPDPWPKKRHLKNRLIQDTFLQDLSRVMKSGGTLEFKTDHHGYFLWAVARFARSPFTIQYYTEDLHRSHRAKYNYTTQFETLFLQKGQPIYYCRLRNQA